MSVYRVLWLSNKHDVDSVVHVNPMPIRQRLVEMDNSSSTGTEFADIWTEESEWSAPQRLSTLTACRTHRGKQMHPRPMQNKN